MFVSDKFLDRFIICPLMYGTKGILILTNCSFLKAHSKRKKDKIY